MNKLIEGIYFYLKLTFSKVLNKRVINRSKIIFTFKNNKFVNTLLF